MPHLDVGTRTPDGPQPGSRALASWSRGTEIIAPPIGLCGGMETANIHTTPSNHGSAPSLLLR